MPERLLLAPVAEPPKEATNTGGALAGVTGGTATMGGTDGSTVTKRSHPDVGSIDVSKSAQDAMTHVVASGSGLLDNKVSRLCNYPEIFLQLASGSGLLDHKVRLPRLPRTSAVVVL